MNWWFMAVVSFVTVAAIHPTPRQKKIKKLAANIGTFANSTVIDMVNMCCLSMYPSNLETLHVGRKRTAWAGINFISCLLHRVYKFHVLQVCFKFVSHLQGKPCASNALAHIAAISVG